MATTRSGGRARHQQKGQAIVLVALLILVLFAMLGLAIDSGRAYPTPAAACSPTS